MLPMKEKRRMRDGHLTNITNKQAVKDRQYTHPYRYGFKICEKLTQCAGAKDICGTIWLLLKSTHMVHTCTPHHGDAPLENSGTPQGVRYTRLTSSDLDKIKHRGQTDMPAKTLKFLRKPIRYTHKYVAFNSFRGRPVGPDRPVGPPWNTSVLIISRDAHGLNLGFFVSGLLLPPTGSAVRFSLL